MFIRDFNFFPLQGDSRDQFPAHHPFRPHRCYEGNQVHMSAMSSQACDKEHNSHTAMAPSSDLFHRSSPGSQ
jgi:hypothetical protein